MSYQVLARKWRPRFFEEMVGQEHVLKALINALNEQRLHHAYLFTGTRGVGKTTIARILAKCLNCEQGVSAKPCGECSSCREIVEGRFIDLIEVDAASRTKVEDTRELLDNVQYAPTRGRYKVYLIDEVHMLSNHSFNALLKTLEEPPEHVKFLLATTDPQKLPVTVLSRCLQFSLKNMTAERIAFYLQKVLRAEAVGFEESALWQLGRAAQGSMRDALSLTDQAIAFGQGQISESQVHDMLGSIDRGRVFKLAEVIATGEVAKLLSEVAQMAEQGPDYDEVVQALLHVWHKVAIAQVAPDTLDNSEGDRQAIMALAQAQRPEDIQLCYQTALLGRKDLPLAADPRQGFEMILLRMLAFKPVQRAPELDLQSCLTAPQTAEAFDASLQPASAVEAAEDAVNGKKPQADAATAASAERENAGSMSDATILSAEAVERLAAGQVSAHDSEHGSGDACVNVRQAAPAPTVVAAYGEASAVLEGSSSADVAAEIMTSVRSGERSLARLVSEADPSSCAVTEAYSGTVSGAIEQSTGGAGSVSDQTQDAAIFRFDYAQLSPQTWWQWVQQLPLAGMPMAIALNSALIERQDYRVWMDVDPQQGALFNDAQRQRIEAVLSAAVGVSVELHMQVQLPRGETPHQRRVRLLAEQRVGAEQAIIDDDEVQAIVSEFEGHIVEGTIRPLVSV